jgi:NAD(P)-dependent dehydrogenase (short-subunit alcohol dehydrogenase family)
MTLDGLAGARVLVTVGASGICAVVAARFAERGARVNVSDMDAGALRTFVAGHPGIGRLGGSAERTVVAASQSSERVCSLARRSGPVGRCGGPEPLRPLFARD